MVVQNRLISAVVALGLSLTSSCSSTSVTPAARPLKNDACAERLHDIAGAFLLFYATHKSWPASEDDVTAALRKEPGVPFICPISGKPYVFESEGLLSPRLSGRILVKDVDGAHASFAWGILVSPPGGTAPVTARVVALGSGAPAPRQ